MDGVLKDTFKTWPGCRCVWTFCCALAKEEIFVKKKRFNRYLFKVTKLLYLSFVCSSTCYRNLKNYREKIVAARSAEQAHQSDEACQDDEAQASMNIQASMKTLSPYKQFEKPESTGIDASSAV